MVFSSKLILFTEDNQLIAENLWIADLFYEANIHFRILARRNSIAKMQSKVPEEYKEKIKFANRGSDNKATIAELKRKGAIFAVIGIVNEDAIFSFNCKIPLFSPSKLNKRRLQFGDKVLKYGLPISHFKEIVECLEVYEIHKKNYFEIHWDDFSVMSLNNANTYNRPSDETRIKQIFEFNLKSEKSVRNQRVLLLLLFHLINEVSTNLYFEQVDYWGTFPSSDPQNLNTSAAFIKESIRTMLNGKPRNGPEILIRVKRMQSKHRSGQRRLSFKSDNDFETLIVNPNLKGKLAGQTVCIIDDYITNGYSAEAARHLLLEAGAEKVIFVSIGKFGKKYYITNYELEGDVFELGYDYNLNNEEEFYGNYNNANDREILDFDDLV